MGLDFMVESTTQKVHILNTITFGLCDGDRAGGEEELKEGQARDRC